MVASNSYSEGRAILASAALIALATIPLVVFGRVCLGVAALRPQLSVLVILWQALERELKVIVVAAATTLALAAYPMFVSGLVNVFLEWRIRSDQTNIRPGYFSIATVDLLVTRLVSYSSRRSSCRSSARVLPLCSGMAFSSPF